MTDRYVVLGNPISHSLSPRIHSLFAEQTGVKLQYERLLVPMGGFETTYAMLRAVGVKGANVTVPFKQEAARLADEVSPAVEFAGAANTLSFGPTGVKADNTDGRGLCIDLERLLNENGLELAGSEIVMIGAGGAASGCVEAFKQAGVAHLTVLNRTAEKAKVLAEKAESIGLPALGLSLDAEVKEQLASARTKVLVNASSSSLGGALPACNQGWFAWADLALDMMYGAKPTAFMMAVSDLRPVAMVADGLGMLVNQASVSFEIWTGHQPDRMATLETVRAWLSNG